jgi:hypothetical protein
MRFSLPLQAATVLFSEAPNLQAQSTHMTINSKKCGILIGLLLGTAGLASASNVITFQVDMTPQITDLSFNPLTDHVYVRGTFNGFPPFATDGLLLTNDPAGINPALYTGTTNNTVDANGSKMRYKFSTDAAAITNLANGYETTLGGNFDRQVILGTNTTIVLPYSYFSDAGAQSVYNATFRVNMAAQIFTGVFNTNTMIVEVQGDFEGWSSGYTLSNDSSIRTTNVNGIISSNVYVGTYPLVGDLGQMNSFKYVINNGGILSYDQPLAINGNTGGDNNRFVHIDTNQSPQILPLVDFSDTPLNNIVTNTVVYRVDLSVMRAAGVLTPSSLVNVRGAFQGWNTGDTSTTMTNDPNAANTNIYTYVRPNVIGTAGTFSEQFKFGIVPSGNSTYEVGPVAGVTYPGTPVLGINGGNRAFTVPNSSGVATLPVVLYSDQTFSDTLPTSTLVTWSVNMTNATAVGGYVFNPASDRLYINGVNITNQNVPPGMNAVAYGGDIASGGVNTALDPFLMTRQGSSLIYTYTQQVPAGFLVRSANYRYSINGTNNEAAAGNHRHYIRTVGSYQMPRDTWGSMISEPTPGFGSLAIGPKSGGTVPVTWNGMPGVRLQVNTNLLVGAGWVQLVDTDATSSTNYPVTGPANFYRLVKPFFLTNYFK